MFSSDVGKKSSSLEPNLNRWSSSSEKTMPKRQTSPLGVVVHNHPKGWDGRKAGLKIWIEKVWRARPGGFANTQSLLVWGLVQCPPHWYRKNNKLREKQDLRPQFIPGGLTSLVQPLDVCLNKPFKDRFTGKNGWLGWWVGKKTFTPGGPSSEQHLS